MRIASPSSPPLGSPPGYATSGMVHAGGTISHGCATEVDLESADGLSIDTLRAYQTSRLAEHGILDTPLRVGMRIPQMVTLCLYQPIDTQYQATSASLWRAGLAHDSPAVSDTNRTFDLPMAKPWRLATGVTCVFDQSGEPDLGYACIWVGDMSASQSKALDDLIGTSGELENAAIHTRSCSNT